MKYSTMLISYQEFDERFGIKYNLFAFQGFISDNQTLTVFQMSLAQNTDPAKFVSHRSCQILEKFSEVWQPNSFLHQPSSIQEPQNACFNNVCTVRSLIIVRLYVSTVGRIIYCFQQIKDNCNVALLN